MIKDSYILVMDYSDEYSAEMTWGFENKNDMFEYALSQTSEVLDMYEIASRIPLTELAEYKSRGREAIREAALAKLTDEEKVVLGVS